MTHVHTPGLRLRILGGAIFFLGVFALLVSAAYFLTSFAYDALAWRPPALLAQVISALLGLLFVLGAAAASSVLFRSRRAGREREIFGPIVRALEQIAQGDFDVRLSDQLAGNELVGGLAQSVNKLAFELNHMERMRQMFISDVSHEIQSPLTSIRGFARALQDDRLGAEERRHYLTIIETESMRLSRLSDNLLRLASLESQQVTLDPKTYRLDKQIRSLILACEPQWSAKRLNLDVAFDELTVTADEDLLSQVWLNLIHNAVKFTPPGGAIRAALHRRDGGVEFSLADSGPGIAPEDQPHIFERFYKADKARERSSESSGLGLAIAQRIAGLHHGVIRCESRPGAGATFIVSLPGNNQ